jgi:3-oxoacyl-[acyl-carrier protein] reductase
VATPAGPADVAYGGSVDHVAIVTGANHGIGAAVAERLAADGVATLVASWRVRVDEATATPERYQERRMSPGQEVVDRIVAAGGRATAVEADLLDVASASMLLEVAEQALGPVDVLVNNATGWVSGDSFTAGAVDHAGRTAPAVTAERFDRTFGVDARAAALLIAGFSERLLARRGGWGRIVGLTSGGRDGFPGEVTYGAAKAALESYTLAAATELGRYGVTANLVHPPVTDTGWVNDEVRAFVAADPDHLHVAEPEDVAEVVAWLCSDAARMVTGNVLRMR